MSRKPFPFCDDTADLTLYQQEVIPTADNPRMPLLPPKANVTTGAYTKGGQKFAERLAEAHNIGRPTDEHITADAIPEGLVRLFESADASTNENVSNLAAGTIKSMSTGIGDVLYVELRLSPFALCPDPLNGRTIATSRAHHLPHFVPVDDHTLGIPVFEIGSAGELLTNVDATRAELGFGEPIVAPGKDYQDLVSIGLQGVHEPMLATITSYRTPTGEHAFVFKCDDGNRRLAATQRALLEASGQTAWSSVAAWSDHFHRSDGSVALREMDAEAVNAMRTKALFNDYRGGVMYPLSGRDEDVSFFLENNAARAIRLRTLLRCRTVPVRLVLGVNTATLAPQARDAASPTAELVAAVVRRLHIAESAQKPWSSETQNLQCALLALTNVRARIAVGADYVPLEDAAAVQVIDNTASDWGSASDDGTHPLRLAAKTLATIICDDHDGTGAVREALKTFSMSVHHSKTDENRAKIGSEVVMAVLGYEDTESQKYKQVRTVIDRVSRGRLFTDVASHPESKTTPWWSLIDTPIDELHTTAKTEVAAILARGDGDMGAATATGTAGAYGPATRALLMMALIAQSSSPVVTAYGGGRIGASPFQITLNGLGGSRGVTKTTPDQVFLRLCVDQAGIDQLAEIVRAALAPVPELPKNLIDPDYEDKNDPSTHGLLTERFLRGPEMGFVKDDDSSDGDTGSGTARATARDARETYRLLVTEMIGHIHAAHAVASMLTDPHPLEPTEGDSTLPDVFRSHGIATSDEQPVSEWLVELTRVFTLGAAFAGRSA